MVQRSDVSEEVEASNFPASAFATALCKMADAAEATNTNIFTLVGLMKESLVEQRATKQLLQDVMTELIQGREELAASRQELATRTAEFGTHAAGLKNEIVAAKEEQVLTRAEMVKAREPVSPR